MVKIQRKKHSKTIIYAQLDGKQSSWPPLKGLRPSAPSLPCLFPRHKQKTNSNFGEVLSTRSTLTERSNKNRMFGGSSHSKTVEIRRAKICENMRLCLFKKKKGEKTGGAIGLDLGIFILGFVGPTPESTSFSFPLFSLSFFFTSPNTKKNAAFPLKALRPFFIGDRVNGYWKWWVLTHGSKYLSRTSA